MTVNQQSASNFTKTCLGPKLSIAQAVITKSPESHLSLPAAPANEVAVPEKAKAATSSMVDLRLTRSLI